MAYISVDKWRTDQVTDWLKGLDDSMYVYINSFTQEEVVGSELLNIRPYELEKLGMHIVGHQEIVLDAVENLRNIHHNLDTENLQFLALHVATAAGSLHRQLSTYNDGSQIETQILNDITHTIATIKPLIGWLNRAPFKGQERYTEVCIRMLRLGLEMATIAQRDRFVEHPVHQIEKTARTLEDLANWIIRVATDPLILQPASLCLVTLKKRESELGFNIESSNHGIHRVTDVKHNSPAHTSGKIEDGDEIVQINYQTVVGWQHKSVLKNLSESSPDVLLTLKKRPKHTKIYGQVYMQPYRLPSKKRTIGARWGGGGGDNSGVPSPRIELLTVPDEKSPFENNRKIIINNNNNNAAAVAAATAAAAVAAASSDSDSSCSDLMTPTDIKEEEKEKRLFYPKPRTMLQRRNTISGDELFGRIFQTTGLPPAWLDREKVGSATCDPSSPSLRDKSKSFAYLEITQRPTTCIGITGATSTTATPAEGTLQNQIDIGSVGVVNLNNNSKNSDDIPKSSIAKQNTAIKDADKFKPGVSKVVRFDANMKFEDYAVDEKYFCNVENTILETFAPIPFVDEEDDDDIDEFGGSINNNNNKIEIEMNDILETLPSEMETETEGEKENAAVVKNSNDIDIDDKRASVPLAEAVNLPIVINLRRGRLDKSHSTPAYDNSGEESDTPPAIEPRKMVLTPPIPPPRPRKQKDILTTTTDNSAIPPPPPAKPASMQPQQKALKATPSTTTEFLTQSTPEISELNTPTRTRTLTLRKKHNLIKRRRNVNLKILGASSDISISSHLYRRTKDHRGVTYWARLYFVMLDTILYGFRSKESQKASSLIFLPGFTVSQAKEVHSKPYAFKVYHAAKTFYFAAESQDALNQWVEYIRMATLQNNNKVNVDHHHHHHEDLNPKDLFSETDSSGEENEILKAKNLSTPSPQQGSKDIVGSSTMTATATNSSSSSSATTTPTTTTAPKQDRRYLGSLRKLTKGSLPFKSSTNSEKKASSDIPVPTAQYRCYRKVPGGSFGIQIGTNTPGYPPVEHQMQVTALTSENQEQQTPPTPTIPMAIGPTSREHTNSQGLQTHGTVGYAATTTTTPTATNELEISTPESIPPALAPKKQQISKTETATTTTTTTETNILGPPSSPAPTLAELKTLSPNGSTSRDDSFDSPSKGSKKMPYNFIHASNPNLLDIDFQTSKALDYSLPKINPADSWDSHKTPHGFVTLKDLMLRKQEEEAQEMYNNRVLLGVEKKAKDDQRRRTTELMMMAANEASISSGTNNNNAGTTTDGKNASRNKLTSRSLPKTPDYEISFKPDDENIKRTRTKEGLKLRDFGYELISGDEPIGGGGSGSGGSGGGHETTSKGTTTTTSRQNSNTSNNSSISNEQQQHQQQHEHSWYARHFLTSVSGGHKHKKHSSNSCSSSISSAADLGDKQRSGSFKKKIGKLEVIKSSSERLFQFNKHNNSTSSSSTTTTPPSGPMLTMTLPLNKKSNHHHHMLDENQRQINIGIGIKKSHTYNNDLKDKAGGVIGKYDAHRKNSAPIFPKLTTSSSNNKIAKEKRLLGSPLLHRTLFGSNSSSSSHHHHQQQQKHQSSTNIFATTQQQQQQNMTSSTLYGGDYDRDYERQEIFSQVTFSKVPSYYGNENGRRRLSSSSHNMQDIATDITNDTTTTTPTTSTSTSNQTQLKTPATTPEYPHMECPPVFQPEIYSLSEPNASLSLLLRRNNSNNGGGSGSGNDAIPSSEDIKQ